MLGFNKGEKGKAKFFRKVYIFFKTKLADSFQVTQNSA